MTSPNADTGRMSYSQTAGRKVIHCSVPSVVAQARAAAPAGELTREQLACVRCGHLILSGSWCNRCRAAVVRRYVGRRLPSAAAAALASKYVDDLDECDCGREKPSAAASCSRCAWLDQHQRSTVQAIVSHLRTQRRATVVEIVEAVGVDRRNVVEALKAMRAEGRVTRMEEEFESEPGVFRGGVMRHVYQLVS